MHLPQLDVMSKWFDVYFAVSKITKGKILKLSLVSKSDIFNVGRSTKIETLSKLFGFYII